MMWCQILVWYEDGNHTLITKLKAGETARDIMRSIKPISKRSFYLYEFFLEKPHIFVAFELKNKSYLMLARLYAKFIKFWIKGGKIIDVTFKENTKDYTNGETFLNIISVWCNTLSENYDSFFTQQPGRIKGLKSVHHILHCMMNPLFGNRAFEVKCYKQMAHWYRIPGKTLKKKH